jgi:hypothetical protein
MGFAELQLHRFIRGRDVGLQFSTNSARLNDMALSATKKQTTAHTHTHERIPEGKINMVSTAAFANRI